MKIVDCQFDLDAASTRSVPLFVAQQECQLRAATFAQELDTDGDKTFKLRNATQSLDLTAALDIDALGALAKADLTSIVTTPIKKGDLIVAVYTVSTAGTVHPGQAAVSIQLDEPVGFGEGPAWAG